MMKMKSLLLVSLLFISNTLIGQSLNEYKYVVIPSKYDFQKTEDQYQLNSLTKFLFEKEGFKTVFDNLEMPADAANNPCGVLTARVNNESNMFTTKMVIELINCKNQKVLTSQEGRSKEKDYKKGYQEALREAFESVSAQNYSYSGKENTISANNTAEDSQKAIMEAAANAKEAAQKVEEKVEVVEIMEISEDENTDEISINEVENKVVEVEETAEVKKQIIVSSNMLYAQANSLGFQLVDSTPKVVYTLLNSSKKDVFLLKDKSGMVYKQNDTWFVEYYNQNELVKKPLNIKF